MKIDVSTIEGYENMTAEQKLEALLSVDVSDSEVAKLKKQISDKNAEIADWKKKHNALLSEDERKKTENEEILTQMQQELETLRREKAVSGFTAKFIGLGLSEADSLKAAESLGDGNFENLFSVLGTYKTNLEKTIKTQLMQGNQAPGGSGGNEVVMTKEKYDKLPMHEKMQFMMEHQEEYEKMKGN